MNRVDTCFQAVQEAAAILASQAGSTRPIYKGDRDPVTGADLASEAFLKRALLGAFPGDGFLGEEGTQELTRTGYLWVADPLDGTVNYAHGHPYFCVSLGLLKDGVPIVGAVAHGVGPEMFQAERGGGSYRAGRRLQVSEVGDLHRALVSTDFPYDQEARLGRGMRRVRALMESCEAVRIRGSAALELCRVGAGELELFAGDGTRSWDLAAGALILEEAGGRLTDWFGAELDLLGDPRFPLATNGFLHGPALEMAQSFGTL